MLMTMQVRFDPMTLGPKQVLDAVVAVGVAEADCKLLVNRSEPKVGPKKVAASKSA